MRYNLLIFNIILFLAVTSLFFYFDYLRIFLRGLHHRKESLNFIKQKVSVVIAARNEEKNISFLLTSLINQSYPDELYEIIVANDGSTDQTSNIVNEFSQKWKNIKLINIRDREKVISPKKNALQQAINAAGGDIILSTDADCITGKYWIESMVANFDEDISMVAGFSKTKLDNWNESNFVQKFEHFDFLTMFFAAAGAISAEKYFSCSGQNIAYRKSAFEQVGKFEKIKHLVSGDDMNLMQLMRKAGMKIKFAFSKHSYVHTKPVQNLIQFLNQRSRWASNTKWQLQLNPEFLVYLISVFLMTILPIILIFLVPWLGITLFLFKALIDYYFIKKGFNVFSIESRKIKFFPIWFVLQPAYIIMVGIIGQFNVFRWKK